MEEVTEGFALLYTQGQDSTGAQERHGPSRTESSTSAQTQGTPRSPQTSSPLELPTQSRPSRTSLSLLMRGRRRRRQSSGHSYTSLVVPQPQPSTLLPDQISPSTSLSSMSLLQAPSSPTQTLSPSGSSHLSLESVAHPIPSSSSASEPTQHRTRSLALSSMLWASDD